MLPPEKEILVWDASFSPELPARFEHIPLKLPEDGHRARASLRGEARDGEIRTKLGLAADATADRPSFVHLDLARDEGRVEAARGMDAIVQTASPFSLPSHAPHAWSPRPLLPITLASKTMIVSALPARNQDRRSATPAPPPR